MVQGQVGVTSGNGVNVHEIVRLDAQVGVEKAGRGGCDRVHRRVQGAGENVNLVVLDVGEGGDQIPSLSIGSRLQRFVGAWAAANLRLHALVGGEDQSASGAIVRPASNDRGTTNPDYSPAERTGRSSLGSSILGFSVSARPSLDGERGRRVWGCGDGFLGAGTRPGAQVMNRARRVETTVRMSSTGNTKARAI